LNAGLGSWQGCRGDHAYNWCKKPSSPVKLVAECCRSSFTLSCSSSPVPLQLFADAGVMAIEHADFDGIERLALVTGAWHLPACCVRCGRCGCCAMSDKGAVGGVLRCGRCVRCACARLLLMVQLLPLPNYAALRTCLAYPLLSSKSRFLQDPVPPTLSLYSLFPAPLPPQAARLPAPLMTPRASSWVGAR
jgi:hypothetical protein